MKLAAPARRADRFFRHPAGGPGHWLSYRLAGADHVVTHADPAEPVPVAHRYEDVDQARLCWRVIQDRIAAAGFRRV